MSIRSTAVLVVCLLRMIPCLASEAVATQPSPADAPGLPAGLAGRVPADTRVYLEVRDLEHLLADGQPGSWLTKLGADAVLGRPGETAASQPAWRTLLAHGVGLPEEVAAPWLVSGDLALAADSWSGIGDAVLLVRPRAPGVMIRALESWQPQAAPGVPTDGTVRRYLLLDGQELATDGLVALIGRRGTRQGLYARATGLWEGAGGESLGAKADFRRRTAGIAADAAVMLYIEGTETLSAGELVSRRWPASWPRLGSVAVGLRVAADAVHVDVSCRLQETLPRTQRGFRAEPFRSLPATTIAAFSWPGDLIRAHRRALTDPGRGVLRALCETLEAGLASEDVESDLLGQFLDDPVIVVNELAMPSAAAAGGDDTTLALSLAMVVRVRDPGVVDAFMSRVLRHLADRHESAGGDRRDAVVRVQPVFGEAQGLIRSVPVAGLLTGAAPRDLLEPLELSYTLHGRRLVLGTHPEAVRHLILASLGRIPTMPPDVVEASLARAEAAGTCHMLAVARPWMAAQTLDALLSRAARAHPELFDPGWWRRVRARGEASRPQLGIRGRALDRAVEVASVEPGGPAAGRLQPGDRILAVDGIALDATRPTDSLRELLAMREQPDIVRLLVQRGTSRSTIEVPMPSAGVQEVVNPLEQLRRASRLMRRVRWAGWVSWRPSEQVWGGRCTLQLAPPVGADSRPSADPPP